MNVKEIKKAIKELNAWKGEDGTTVKVTAGTDEELAENFLEAVNGLPEGTNLPDGVVSVYEKLTEEAEEPEEEEKEEEAEEEETEEETEEEEAEEEEKPAKKDKKEKKVDKKVVKSNGKEKKEKKEKKEPAGKTAWGHRINSMSGKIDELLTAGTTLKSAVSTLVKQFNKEEKAAKSKFLSHIESLKEMKITVTEKDGTYKAKK